ncbi:sensor histidine kinase [Derxia gummosa]|uniref:Sensor histidine kinase n=1 Tax=Derxia gummosa DSM 723 TaxID=1121388 RepID=A0A8B6XAM0_9BURK|nr:histidine kinase [Derxia gummosa]
MRAGSSKPQAETIEVCSRPPTPAPDYCNFGTVLRVLGLANVGLFVSGLMRSHSLDSFLLAVLEQGAIVEPLTLVCITTLCSIRARLGGIHSRARSVIAGAIGAAWALVLMLATGAFVAVESWPSLTTLLMRVAGFGLAALMIAWTIELRARAVSPALADARLQALQARIRPHFLFNSLNAAMSLVRIDPPLAERVLDDLAELFRASMGDARALVPLEDEVRLARQYVDVEQVRIGDRLSVEWELERMPGKYPVPALLLQPLLENAVHHGIEPAEGPGLVRVRITGVGRELIIVVENTYDPVIRRRPGNRLALANIRERLSLLYDFEARLRVGGDGKLWRVSITLPFNPEDGDQD